MEKVIKYIEEHQQEYIELLKKFCSQPSVSAQNWGIQEMVQLVRDTLDGLGVNTERLETDGYPIIYGELGNNKKKTLTFYNHYDVQPPEPLEKWKTEPFTPTIIDGRIYARGVADNKGSFLSRVCAVDAYKKVYGELPVNIKFITEGEEEVGSVHLDEFRIKYPEKLATNGIVWEGGSKDINRGPLQITLGFKGLCYIELRCRGAKKDLHSMNAAVVVNPAWRLIWALSTMKNEKDVITIDGFYDDVIKPTKEDMHYLDCFNYDEERIKNSVGINSFINDLKGIDLKEKYLYQSTCNIAGFESGYTGEGAKTVLPSYAFCKIDLRLVEGQDAEKTVELIRKHLDKRGFTDIEVIMLSGKNSYRTDANSAIVKASLESAEEIYEMKPSVYRNDPGTTSMGTFCGPTGIPAVSFGIDHEESNIHAPNENIYLEDYINGIKMTALVINKFSIYE
jgi:acetylornithine deacetylase/succinyl-diaminopimelate desuccinylase-like protein